MTKLVQLQQKTGEVMRKWRREHPTPVPARIVTNDPIAIEPPRPRPETGKFPPISLPMPIQSSLSALEQLEQMVQTSPLPRVGIDISLKPTHPLEHADTGPIKLQPLACVHYHKSAGKPLQMLYGATIECVERLSSLPDVLYISTERLDELKVQYTRIFRQSYTGTFPFFSGANRLELIPVFCENLLPDEIKANIRISRDEVIAICERSGMRS